MKLNIYHGKTFLHQSQPYLKILWCLESTTQPVVSASPIPASLPNIWWPGLWHHPDLFANLARRLDTALSP